MSTDGLLWLQGKLALSDADGKAQALDYIKTLQEDNARLQASLSSEKASKTGTPVLIGAELAQIEATISNLKLAEQSVQSIAPTPETSAS